MDTMHDEIGRGNCLQGVCKTLNSRCDVLLSSIYATASSYKRLTVCGVQLDDDFLEEHLSRINDDAECTNTVAGECTAPSSAFRLDDPLIPELLSWISCAAILGGLAGSVAVASCCEAIGRAKGAPVTSAPTSNATASTSSMDSDSEGSLSNEASKELHQQDLQVGQALGQARPTWMALCCSD